MNFTLKKVLTNTKYSVTIFAKHFKDLLMKKKGVLYVIMLLVWTALSVLLWTTFVPYMQNVPYFESGDKSFVIKFLSVGLLIFNGIFICYFWLNGVKDFIYVIWYYVSKNRLMRQYESVMDTDVSESKEKVLMLYCTCNDFDGASLLRCMEQKYKYVEFVILDDSHKEEYKQQIDDFATLHNVKVVRRKDRKGFKAGNINNFLSSENCPDYDYVVILDSDEIIPKNYVESCLKYFYYYDNIGIVQANHISTRNSNFFMRLFHIGVNSHWPTYQIMKHNYGFSTMLGHGAMIKRECYEQAGGFPELVAEDLCLSIEARNKGYLVAFAPNIICEEEYPVDYVAFKKRHSKWTQGNLEFIKKYTGKICRSSMSWYEKLDIVLFTYNLPLTAIFVFFIFLNLLFAPMLGINLGAVYKLWMLIPTIIFFFSPMLNDVFTWSTRLNPVSFIIYFFSVIVLYGSMLTTSLVSALLGMFGKKAKFIVTPKTSHKITFGFALRFQLQELIFSSVLLTFSALMTIFFRGNYLFSVFLIFVTGYLSVLLLFLSNKTYNEKEIEKYDEKIKIKTLKINQAYKYDNLTDVLR